MKDEIESDRKGNERKLSESREWKVRGKFTR